jgi:4-alpha-glucanotransferase
MSRHYLSPLYLRIEDIPEYAALGASEKNRIEALAAPLRAASASAALIDRDAVWTAKRAALELIRAVPLTAARRADLDAFLAAEGRALTQWATWCAIAELHGPDWRRWPASLADPDTAAVPALRAERAETVEFHSWLQWLASGQADQAQAAARNAGMRIGVIADLAVGSHPGGADAWAGRDVLVSGVSVGAPPDEFNQLGQDWSLRPWHPERLAERAAEPLAELTSAVVRHAGGLRIDHVMGLSRLWWIPEGMSPERGTYVRYDHELLGDVLAAGAARAGAVIIGEDMGTVEPWLPEFLAERRILGTSVLWFERDAEGRPRRPYAWRRDCLATVGTHDIPPAAAFLTGEQIKIRNELGLLTRSFGEEWANGAREMGEWLRALTYAGVMPMRQGLPSVTEFTTALYAYLAKTPARLIGVSLAEAAGDRRPQNIPGTTDQYPNWQVPLCDGAGEPVLLEDLPARADMASVICAVSGR